MWVSPLPEEILGRYDLCQRKCSGAERYRDVLIYQKGYQLTETDQAFLAKIRQVQGEIVAKRSSDAKTAHFGAAQRKKEDQGLAHTKRLLALLGGRAEVFVPPEIARQLGAAAISRDMLSKIHLAITLGGDGTIISRARMLLGYEIPLLGVNLGRLGYLAQVEPDALAQAVEHVIAGRYSVEHRILLEGQVWTEQGR